MDCSLPRIIRSEPYCEQPWGRFSSGFSNKTRFMKCDACVHALLLLRAHSKSHSHWHLPANYSRSTSLSQSPNYNFIIPDLFLYTHSQKGRRYGCTPKGIHKILYQEHWLITVKSHRQCQSFGRHCTSCSWSFLNPFMSRWEGAVVCLKAVW